ncbi:MAG: ubiquinone/menaquinone biosynthesis methyltransferase [Candidatus Binatia bacterium]|nr:ubiquinone/menaquinone biosynthesis methyltransferase [Candidatus Binatia bacterium]
MAASENPRDRAVQHMFNRIARRYDLLNRVISFRLDNRWRKQAIQSIWTADNPLILDLGTGTGDLTFSALKWSPTGKPVGRNPEQEPRAKAGARVEGAPGGGRIVGLDFSLEMLKLAQTKSRSLPHGEQTHFVLGSALVAPFRDAVFDGVMSAFVLRNVSDLALFFSQAFRVLRPGGRIVTLDMFPPSTGLFAKFYGLYFYRLVPRIGALLARDRDAYQYLSESVRTFHSPMMVAKILKQTGFEHIRWRKFLCGSVCMHVAERPNSSGIPA